MNYKVENNTGFPIMIASDSGGPLEVDSGEIDKLWKVFGYASALAESNGIHNAESRIHRMIDYNGELEVCWKNSVDSGLSYYIVCAWARYSEKERRPVGASDDPRHPAVKPCGAT